MRTRLKPKTEVISKKNNFFMSSKASVYHAVVVIFLEFFAFGLLTAPMITVLDKTFPRHTFLMNGLIQGVKGFLSFLSAPLIGALSDLFGRKPFLVLTVACTCSPIPLLMTGSHWWYFTTLTISGLFSVTFSVVFAYVADITQGDNERSRAYGLVSATFAASLVISPTVGAYLGTVYSDSFVVALATAVALLDVFFILACVPESLPDSARLLSNSSQSGGKKMSWDKADPFAALRQIGQEPLILLLCIVVFLSYLPEAGQYSCIFVYLRLIVGFSEHQVALYIGYVGVLSCLAQTIFLQWLMQPNVGGPRTTVLFGLTCEAIQLILCGLAASANAPVWLTAGLVASLGSITYPAISAYVSHQADATAIRNGGHASTGQGVAQGVLTGVRGLCSGLGPALFGCIFYLFQVDLSGGASSSVLAHPVIGGIKFKYHNTTDYSIKTEEHRLIPGPPFLVGSILVLVAMIVCFLLPRDNGKTSSKPSNDNDSIADYSFDSSNIESTDTNPIIERISNLPVRNNYIPLPTTSSDDIDNQSHTHINIPSSPTLEISSLTSSTNKSSNISMLPTVVNNNNNQKPEFPYTPNITVMHKDNKLSRGLRYIKSVASTKQATS